MPDYGLYKLTNSTEIPRFVGSPVPELSQAAQVLQQRYDTALNTEDQLDQYIKGASSLTQDQAVLQELKEKFRTQLKARAEKGDYENMVRETARDARMFVQEYAPIAANQKAVQEYRKQIDEDVRAGKFSKDAAEKALAYSLGTYKGLKKDPVTGQYGNQFSGYSLGKEIDIAEFTKKAVEGLDPQKIGSNVRKDVGGFYVEQGGQKTYLGMDRIWPAVQAYMQSNPEYQSYIKQRQTLDNWQLGTFTDQQIESIAERGGFSPQMMSTARELAQSQRVSLGTALQAISAQSTKAQIEGDIMRMAEKYQRNDRDSWYKVMGETEDRGRAIADAKEKEKNFFGLNFTTRDNQANIPDSAAFDDLQTGVTAGLTQATNDWQTFMQSVKTTIGPDGQYRHTAADGTDVTDKGRTLKNQVDHMYREKSRMDEIKKKAELASGYNPATGLEDAFKEALAERTSGKAFATKEYPLLSNLTKQPTGTLLSAAWEYFKGNTAKSAQLLSEGEKQFLEDNREIVTREMERKNSSFGKYNAALRNYMNGTSETTHMLFINDDATRKRLGSFATSLAGRGIGEQGVMSLSIGTGKNQGTQLTADEYANIAGELEAISVFNDNATGRTKIAFRANQDVKGKKTAGENIIVELSNLTGVDEFLRNSLPPQEYFKFKLDGMVKGELGGSPSKTATITLPNGLPAEIRKKHNQGIATYDVKFHTSTKPIIMQDLKQDELLNTLMRSQ